MPPWPSFGHVINLNLVHIILVFCITCTFCHQSPCPEQNWWNPKRNLCIKCTKCDDQLIVLRPCQPHMDTICGTLNDIEIEDSRSGSTAQTIERNINWKERRKETKNNSQQTYDIRWDWQAASLALAALACLLFFIVAAYISYQHAKQWRKMERMERRFDRDVEELSGLMHTIVDIKSMENGRIVLEKPNKDRVFNPLEVRCVYLEQLLSGQTDLMNINNKSFEVKSCNTTNSNLSQSMRNTNRSNNHHLMVNGATASMETYTLDDE